MNKERTYYQLLRENRQLRDIIYWLTIAVVITGALMVFFAELYMGNL